jgi:hypothetical protein
VLLQNKMLKTLFYTLKKKSSIHRTTLTKELNCTLGQLKVEPKLTTHALEKLLQYKH